MNPIRILSLAAAVAMAGLGAGGLEAQQSQQTRQGSAKAGAGITIAEPYWQALDADSAATVKKAWRAALELVAADLGPSFAPTLSNQAAPAAGRQGPLLRATIAGQRGSYSAVFQLEGIPPATGAASGAASGAATGAATAAEANAARYLSFAAVEPSTALEFARALESLLRLLEPRPSRPSPVLVDAFSPSELVGVDFASDPSLFYPYGLAARPDGSLLVACGQTVLELDGFWRVKGLPAKRLSDEGNLVFAYGLALTPAGTLFVRSADGSGLWAFAEGSEDYRRLRLDAPAGSIFGVMGDGSPFVVSMQPRLARVYGARGRRDLPLAADASVYAASSGPDGTLWLVDAARGSIRIVDAEGGLRDIVYPELPPGMVLMKLRVLADGGFLGATQTDLRRFDASGRLLWVWDGKESGLALSFLPNSDLAVAPGGIVYVNDFMGRRILRLAEDPAALPPPLARIARADRALRSEPARPELRLALAEAYEAAGALESARAEFGRYLEERPADARAADREQGLRIELLAAKAAAAEKDARARLSRFGPETAREAYGRAMRTLEGLAAAKPGDAALAERMRSLRAAFQAAERGAAAAPRSPELVRVELAALFPSLLQAYRGRPAGRVVVRNSLGEPLTRLSAELFVQKYMDYPSRGPELASLKPGAEAALELSALLNERVLEVEEDLPLQARIKLRFTDSGGERTMELFRPVTLYRRTAIAWDDSGKLAGFVTPNEESVSRIAFESLAPAAAPAAGAAGPRPAAPDLVSTRFQRAVALGGALGALPLSYVPDPGSPIAAALGRGEAVDTVRFPRTTLAYRGGDCDDTTALLASVLEAAGIPTAILTTPGHVFLAFDSGEDGESAWLFAAPGYETVVAGGRTWIPLESTVLGAGFAAAWKEASLLVARHRGGKDFEFLPLAALRAAYPALPLPPGLLPAARPDAEAKAALAAKDRAALLAELYAPLAAQGEAARASARGKDWSRATNRLARLAASYGDPDRARSALAEIIAREPGYVAAYLNLATLALAAGKREEAAALLKRAEGASPGTAAVRAYAERTGLVAALGPGQGAAKPGTAAGSASGSAAGSAAGGSAPGAAGPALADSAAAGTRAAGAEAPRWEE